MIHYTTTRDLSNVILQSGDIHGIITNQLNFIIELATATDDEANEQQRNWANQLLNEYVQLPIIAPGVVPDATYLARLTAIVNNAIRARKRNPPTMTMLVTNLNLTDLRQFLYVRPPIANGNVHMTRNQINTLNLDQVRQYVRQLWSDVFAA